jgi:hypothetical protein
MVDPVQYQPQATQEQKQQPTPMAMSEAVSAPEPQIRKDIKPPSSSASSPPPKITKTTL